MSALREPCVREPSLLALACGLRAAIDRFDRLLATHAPSDGGDGGDGDGGDDSGGGAPDALTGMVLGLLALRDRLDRELARADAAGGGERRVPRRAPRPVTGGLLR